MPRPGGRGFPINVNRRNPFARARSGISRRSGGIAGKDITGRQILEGANALEATLEGLRDSVRKRIMRGAVNRALVIVAGEIRKSVPKAKTPGHNMTRRVKKSVGYRKFLAKRDIYSGKAGLRVGSRRNATIAPHAHFIPLGTKDRYTKSGAFRGRVQPRGFVPEAFKRVEVRAVEEMRKRFKKNFDREVEKQRRKNRAKG